MPSRISVQDLKPRDVIRFDHRAVGVSIGVVVRTYTSGGKHGASVIAVGSDQTQIQTQLREGNIQELLWREDTEAK